MVVTGVDGGYPYGNKLINYMLIKDINLIYAQGA
jgi:hypothetical protein